MQCSVSILKVNHIGGGKIIEIFLYKVSQFYFLEFAVPAETLSSGIELLLLYLYLTDCWRIAPPLLRNLSYGVLISTLQLSSSDWRKFGFGKKKKKTEQVEFAVLLQVSPRSVSLYICAAKQCTCQIFMVLLVGRNTVMEE